MAGLRSLLVLSVAAVLWQAGVAKADYCGATRYARCGHACRCAQCCTCSVTCTVMKQCVETVYDEEERTYYKTVFEEVVEKHPVEAVKYVEETRYRCQPTTIWQEKESCCPTQPCAPSCGQTAGSCCQPQTCKQMVSEQVLRKVPYTVMKAVTYQKMEERPRVVTRQVPYTITVCIPRQVIKEVPVQVCCPLPCCCGCGSGAAGCGCR